MSSSPPSSLLSPQFAAVILGAVLLSWALRPRAARAKTQGALPPGPKPVPLLGNVRDLQAKELWIPARRWAQSYGDVTYLHVLGVGLVFLNSADAAADLLDRRGALYSDKPALVMAGELCGCKNMVAFTPYGSQSKRQRRLLHKALGAPTIPSYHPLITTETHAFLRRLIVTPAAYTRHIRRYAGGLTLSVIYGYEVVSDGPTAAITSTSTDSAHADAHADAGLKPEVDEMLSLAEECVGLLANRIASGGGIWPVDVFPWLQRLPGWLPGMGFMRNARVWKRKMEEFVDRPYEYVKKSMKSGNYKQSFCSMLLSDESMHGSNREQFEFDLKWSANSMYAASIDTTITAVSHFILAMMMHPEAQQRAQAEIDAVCGQSRMPNFEDRAALPFVECIFKECLRWGVPVPLNLPHRLTEDDVYNGMFIPKGSLVFGNIWAMMRDERVYPNADAFVPERFLETVSPEEERKRDPKRYVFGFGRRACPGENLVDSSVWLLMATMLATLDISKAVDERGNIIEPVYDFENPVFRTPSTFKCDMRPRGPKALSLITQSDIFGA